MTEAQKNLAGWCILALIGVVAIALAIAFATYGVPLIVIIACLIGGLYIGDNVDHVDGGAALVILAIFAVSLVVAITAPWGYGVIATGVAGFITGLLAQTRIR